MKKLLRILALLIAVIQIQSVSVFAETQYYQGTEENTLEYPMSDYDEGEYDEGTSLFEQNIRTYNKYMPDFYETLPNGLVRYKAPKLKDTDYYVYGDVTSDGILSDEDISKFQEMITGQDDDYLFQAADYSSDGNINVFDLAALKRKMLYGADLSEIKICLDPGHYSNQYNTPDFSCYTDYTCDYIYDDGTVGDTFLSQYYESAMSWKLHIYLSYELEKYGFQVETTRHYLKDDLAVQTRGQTAIGCDLFLSLHSNAASISDATQPIAIVNYDENTPITLSEGDDADLDRELINVSQEIGKILAVTVSDTMNKSDIDISTGVIWSRTGEFRTTVENYEWYGVLGGCRGVNVPGILLEHSYHTNPTAVSWLSKEDNLKALAKAEAAALAEYYGYYNAENITYAERLYQNSK